MDQATIQITEAAEPLIDAYNINKAYIETGRGKESPFPVWIEQGGSRSGKTYKILQFIGPYIFMSGRKGRIVNGEHTPFIVDIVRKHSTLLDDAVRDFIEIMTSACLWHPKEKAENGHQRWNPTRRIYNLDTVVWHFYGITNESDARGPKRDLLFINEGTELGASVFKQLRRRIREFIIIDFNPSAKFWAHDLYIEDKAVLQKHPENYSVEDIYALEGCDDTENGEEITPMSYGMQITTYKDNPFLDDVTIRALLEDNKDPYFAQVYLKGELGVWQGKIYKHWSNEFNHEAWKKSPRGVFGMDFGTNDPTVLVEVRVGNDNIVRVWEHIYESNLNPSGLIDLLNQVPGLRGSPIYGDHERWILDIMRGAGFAIHKAWKQGQGMNKVDQVRMVQRLGRVEYYGSNTHNEVSRYEFEKDRDGNPKYGVLPDGNDHAMDASRYGIYSGVKSKNLTIRKVM